MIVFVVLIIVSVFFICELLNWVCIRFLVGRLVICIILIVMFVLVNLLLLYLVRLVKCECLEGVLVIIMI